MKKIPLERARRIVLGAQGLTTERPAGRVDARHLRKMFRSIGVLQIDSVNVIERAHHLTSFARLGIHDRELLWNAMRNRELFEYWGHEAAFLPIETWPLWRHRMDAMGDWSRVRELREREPGYIDKVEEEVSRRGPLTPSELEDPGDRDVVKVHLVLADQVEQKVHRACEYFQINAVMGHSMSLR